MSNTVGDGTSPSVAQRTPREAWEDLIAGNARFVQGASRHPDMDDRRRQALRSAQQPFCLAFGCSDSRVPAELVFDQGLGSLFVVRTAGHVVDTAAVGSIEYGVSVLEIPLVVVLGHESCGAVTAATEAFESGEMPSGFVRDLVERITPSIFSAARRDVLDVDSIVLEHVRYTVSLLTERSRAVAEAVESGHLAIVGAVYSITDGTIRRVTAIGDV